MLTEKRSLLHQNKCSVSKSFRVKLHVEIHFNEVNVSFGFLSPYEVKRHLM